MNMSIKDGSAHVSHPRSRSEPTFEPTCEVSIPKDSSKKRKAVQQSLDQGSSSPKRRRFEDKKPVLQKPPITGQDRIPPPLTRRALHQLNKYQHPTLTNSPSDTESGPMANSDLSHEQSVADSSVSHSSIEKGKGKNAYQPDYQSLLEDRDIFFADDNAELVPSDLADLKKAIYASRGSSEPDEAAATILRKQIRKAPNEAATIQSILPKVVPLEELMNDEKLSTSLEQYWSRSCLIGPEMKPRLAVPKPDRTIGWAADMFRQYKNARYVLKTQMQPVGNNANLVWPIFTVEVKGDKGDMKTAKLQNLHNGATMLSNLWTLRQASGKLDEFYNKTHVMSLELTAESVQLSCYWAVSHTETHGIRWYGMNIDTWSVYNTKNYIEAGRCTHNALEYVRKSALPWIESDLAVIEEGLAPKMPTTLMPTPSTESIKGTKQNKRAISLASGLNTAFGQAASTPSKKACIGKPSEDGNFP